MSKRQTKVAGYNPRFVTWWINGSRDPVTVEFPSRRVATRTRQDLYALRNAMRREQHYATTFANKAEIIRRPVDPLHTDIDDPHSLTIRPANFDANPFLDKAGIAEPVAPSDSVPELPTGEDLPALPFDYESLMKPRRE